MACDPGEEDRVVALAEELDATIRLLKRRLGEIGDRRLAVMAGMTVLDKLKDAEARLAETQERINKLERAREAAALAAETEDEPLIARLDAATAAVERLTRTLVDEAHALSGEDASAAAFSHARGASAGFAYASRPLGEGTRATPKPAAGSDQSDIPGTDEPGRDGGRDAQGDPDAASEDQGAAGFTRAGRS